MMDKIKTTNQLDNMVFASTQLINNKNLHFAGKILTKYGVSRGTDHFMALVLRRYSNLFTEAKGEGSGFGPPVINNYVNYLNVYNNIANWAGEMIKHQYRCDTRYVSALSRSSQGNSRQEHNIFAEKSSSSSSAGIGLLERIFTQKKDTLGKTQMPGISNTHLYQNIGKTIHNIVSSTAPENSMSFKSEKQGQGRIEEYEWAFRSKALGYMAGAAETVKDSKEAKVRSWDPLPGKAPDEAGIVAKLILERFSRFEVKALPNIMIQRNAAGLKSGGRHMNTVTVKSYLSSIPEHDRLQSRIRDDSETVHPYTALNIVEEQELESRFGDKFTYKALHKAEMKQEEIDIGPRNQNAKQGSLVLHKPAAGEAAAAVKKPEPTGFYDKAQKQTQASKNMDSQDISLLADRVFKILEKRIAIQKDRRGLL
ncbi:MAG: hypothetical protein K0R84_1071 [Clostridia bacterium]|jgi:hypothetical protein|nr:hypothetical protein [Clostridia bacterium]